MKKMLHFAWVSLSGFIASAPKIPPPVLIPATPIRLPALAATRSERIELVDYHGGYFFQLTLPNVPYPSSVTGWIRSLVMGIWLVLVGIVTIQTTQAQWVPQGSAIPGEAIGDRVGYSVSLSSDGRTMAVGAPSISSNPGQVKVYKLVSGVWTLLGNAIRGGTESDNVGYSVSLSSDGQTLALGAPDNSLFRGQVKVYKLMSGVWTLLGNAIQGDVADDLAGWSVSLSSDGQTLAVGEPYNSSNQGQVKVYKLVSGVWTLQGSAIQGEAANDRAGTSVSLSSNGQILAVGSPLNNSQQGQVKVYKLVSGVWTLQGNAIQGEAANDLAGYSVSLSSDGQTLAVGAYGNSSQKGQVKVYKLMSGVWTLQGNAIQGEAANDLAGYSVSLSSDGQTLAVGAYGNSSQKGQVKVYKLVGGVWTLLNSAIQGNVADDLAGWSVSLSADGQTLALGAPNNSSYTGQVKVYRVVSLVADLTSSLSARPSILYGSSTLTVVVNVVEINDQASTGPVTLKITKDTKISLSFPGSASSVGGRPVQNSEWSFDPTTSGYYTLTSLGPVPAGGVLSVGLEGLLSPASTTGRLSISATISAGDTQMLNNADADRIDYFP